MELLNTARDFLKDKDGKEGVVAGYVKNSLSDMLSKVDDTNFSTIVGFLSSLEEVAGNFKNDTTQAYTQVLIIFDSWKATC
jgi:hypothetical protein